MTNSNNVIREDLALVFPGQGSQRMGMFSALVDQFPCIQETFSIASQVLGYDLWALSQHGPEEKLAETEITQPLMLAAGVAIWQVWQSVGGLKPKLMAGHSLGEYTALVCAEAIDFEAAVEIVQLRGRYMQEAVPVGQGAMLAVIGLSDEKILEICDHLTLPGSGKIVTAANFNAPGQVVVGGHSELVEKVAELAKAAGAIKVVPVAMSAPSHCELMRPAADALAIHLEKLSILPAQLPIVNNFNAQLTQDPGEIRAALIAQVCNPVRWTECIQKFVQEGIKYSFEAGPGKVLAGLSRRIDKSLVNKSLGNLVGLNAAIELMNQSE